MAKKLLEIAAEIVSSQVTTSSMSSEEIAASLQKVFLTLQAMQKSETDGTPLDLPVLAAAPTEEEGEEKVAPEDSIREDKIVCIECGLEMRQLTAKHLGSHGLTPKEYKKKYGFPMKTPLSARSLTKARSKAAKKRGLPANLVKFQETRKQQKAESSLPEGGSEGSGLEGGVSSQKKAKKSSKQD
ncbi:MAG: MucR family transcriptional regulator [Syntrophobacteraceae bacterium]|nr:MucR family transcriptional regulator [Desulfobacteraceae bacterium]